MTTGEIKNPGYGIYNTDDDHNPCRYNKSIFTKTPFKDQRDGKWCEKCLKAGVYTWVTKYKDFVGCKEHYPAVSGNRPTERG